MGDCAREMLPTLFNCLPSCQAVANCQNTHTQHTHPGDPGIGFGHEFRGGCEPEEEVPWRCKAKRKRGTFALNVFAFWNVSRFDCKASAGGGQRGRVLRGHGVKEMGSILILILQKRQTRGNVINSGAKLYDLQIPDKKL